MTDKDGDLFAMGACAQCKAPMMLAEIYVLGPVCGKCCKANHRRVTSGVAAKNKRQE